MVFPSRDDRGSDSTGTFEGPLYDTKDGIYGIFFRKIIEKVTSVGSSNPQMDPYVEIVRDGGA